MSSLMKPLSVLWGTFNHRSALAARARRACAAPAMRSSVVTMPGDRLWMPTLLMFRSFSSACSSLLPLNQQHKLRLGACAPLTVASARSF